MRCSDCSKDIPTKSGFCPYCGSAQTIADGYDSSDDAFFPVDRCAGIYQVAPHGLATELRQGVALTNG